MYVTVRTSRQRVYYFEHDKLLQGLNAYTHTTKSRNLALSRGQIYQSARVPEVTPGTLPSPDIIIYIYSYYSEAGALDTGVFYKR